MSDTLDLRSLRFTPLRDLVRGRVTGALDWRRRIDAAGLPTEVRDLLLRIVRRTRLWRSERVAVADELIAHFADALSSGESTGSVVEAFGDERTIALLIRRAKRRNRPLAWHALKYLSRTFLVLFAIYLLIIIRFVMSRPTLSVDYLAQMNAGAVRLPNQERAWPTYREAILALGTSSSADRKQLERRLDANFADNEVGDRMLSDATSDDAEWPELTAWLDSHQRGLELLREAAGKRSMGFILGPGGSEQDEALGWNFRHPGRSENTIDTPIISVLLPHLNDMRWLARVLEADLRYARSKGDGTRAASDLEAMIGVGRHQDAPFMVTGLVGIGIDRLALLRLNEILAETPELFDDGTLKRLAHLLATIGGDTASSLLSLDGEIASFKDAIQRIYSDNGNGDGHMTAQGARFAAQLYGDASYGPIGNIDYTSPSALGFTARTAAESVLSSRRDVVAEFERLMAIQQDRFSHPLRDSRHSDEVESRISELRQSSAVSRTKYAAVLNMFPALDRAAETAEQLLGQREGAMIGIALEAYRRQHGSYPDRLAALSPELLPAVPVDRITGQALNYRLIDGRPVIYSVGVDRDDDGGRPALDHSQKPDPLRAGRWKMPSSHNGATIDGDWILFDGRSAARG